MIILALLLTLSTSPSLSHQELVERCPPLAAMVEMHRDAGPACIMRWTVAQQHRMNAQLQELSRTLQQLLDELKARQHPDT